MGLGDVNTYSQPNIAGSGLDLASLAGVDNLDSFNMFMGISHCFFCVNNGGDPVAIPQWNGNLTTGTAASGIWTLECDPIPDDLTAIVGWSMPPIFLQMTGAATTGDFVEITYVPSTGIYTIDWNIAAGTPITQSLFVFWALVITPNRDRTQQERVVALGGGD